MAGLLVCTASFAQTATLKGRIVDENNHPVPGSAIKVYKSGKVVEMTADNNGIFYAQDLQAGSYFVDINAGGRVSRATRILLLPEGRVRSFFNFKLFSKGVVVSRMPEGRVMANNL